MEIIYEGAIWMVTSNDGKVIKNHMILFIEGGENGFNGFRCGENLNFSHLNSYLGICKLCPTLISHIFTSNFLTLSFVLELYHKTKSFNL